MFEIVLCNKLRLQCREQIALVPCQERRIVVHFCVFIGFCMDMLLAWPPVFSQDRDIDDQLLEIGKEGAAALEGQPVLVPEKVLVDKEIKYIVGKDNEWFTEDDSIYEHYQILHDNAGKIIKRSCFKVGKDMQPYTYDDKLQNFQTFEYGFDGKLLKETSFDGQN